jgi:hypothetical protein
MSKRIVLQVSPGADHALARFRASSAIKAFNLGVELLQTAIPAGSVRLYEALVHTKHPDVTFSFEYGVAA